MLGGQLTDTRLATDLLNFLPDKYGNFPLILRKESIEANDGIYDLIKAFQRQRFSQGTIQVRNQRSNNFDNAGKESVANNFT